MAREFHADRLAFRICCPQCETAWDTFDVPAYCPNYDCGAMVTFRTVKWTARELRRADGEAKKMAEYFANDPALKE